MPADRPAPAKNASSAPTTRERILATASELFYAYGIRATSADRIIERVGITKVTFYRHFRTKTDLVVAYLEQQAQGERTWLSNVHSAQDPAGSLRRLAMDLGAASCRPGFRGCAFINAAAEFSEPDDPVRTVVADHRGWMLDMFTDIATEAGTPEPQAAAKQLMLLRDGAMVNGYLGDAASVADSLAAAFDAIIAHSTPSTG